MARASGEQFGSYLLEAAIGASQMNSSEISRVLGIPAATIRSRVQRGHALLEAALRRLATSKEVLESTLGNLDGWARQMREDARGRE